MSLLWENFASAQLVAPILATDTQVEVTAGFGDDFPEPVAPDYAVLVMEDAGSNREVVHLVARNVDVLTVVRGQEGTLANDYPIDSRIELRVTAGFLQDFVDGGEF